MRTETDFYVYLHTTSGGIPFYVGKGRGRRDKDILRRSSFWKKVVKKYGFVVSRLVDNVAENEAYMWERKFIDFYGLRKRGEGPLVNFTDGGERGYSRTECQKIRQSKCMTGRKLSDEHKRKISNSLVGKRKPDDFGAKMRLRKPTDETKEKIRKAHIGMKMNYSEEERKKRSERMKSTWVNNPEKFFYRHSPETLDKMRLAWVKRKAKTHNAKAVSR